MSWQQKKKISISNTGKKRTKQQIKNISKGAKGKKRSLEARENIRNGHRGKKNYLWKGEAAGYRSKHHWIESERGKPHYCEHCKKSNLPHRQYHWANKDHKYKRILSHWMRLCVKCHKKYDGN